MIRGLHGLFYSSDSEATRAFMRDVLKLPYTDVGGGWLIFDLPEGDIGVHPIDESGQPAVNTHDVSFYCDDIHGTVAELRARGVEFKTEPADHGYGFVTYFTMPGGIEVQLYEPKYAKAPAKKAPAVKPAKKAASAKKASTKKPAAKKAPAKKPAAKRALARKASKR
jgi:predicted enzyme related to lactoylglutathione lyase